MSSLWARLEEAYERQGTSFSGGGHFSFSTVGSQSGARLRQMQRCAMCVKSLYTEGF